MSDNDHNDISDLFKKIRDRLILSAVTNKLEYLHYKDSIFESEIIKAEYEEAFYYFPYEVINAFDTIQIFYEFYTTDVWGSIGPMKYSDETYNASFREIENRIKRLKSDYILDKLTEKYSNISYDIPRALTGFKRENKLPEDYSEKDAVINLHNKYRKVLINPDLQLKIFNSIHLNKGISDLYTEILLDLIEERLKLYDLKIEKYTRKSATRDLSAKFNNEENIPLIKLNYKLDQQKQILSQLHNKLYPEYIDDSYEQFESHFIESNIEFRQTVWKGLEREIAHLFKALKDSKIILSQDQNKLIQIHFLNRKEKPFRNQQLRVAISQSQIETFQSIFQIVEAVKELSAKF